ncbi:MAG: hypothetical protein ABFD60_07970 [Bryobacteraceae bacterium]
MSEESVAIREADALPAWNPQQVIAQVKLVQDVMHAVMRSDEHYGTIPGTKKPSLYKAGAEKLGMTFRLSPEFIITEKELSAGHREYAITCKLSSIQTGSFIAAGVGTCSTMETKYRYRDSKRKCPACGQEAIIKGKDDWGGGWVCYKKQGGCNAKYADGDKAIEGQTVGRIENPDIADTYNTVLKMAKKRAHVDAILTATAASDIFTQDVEDFKDSAPTTDSKTPQDTEQQQKESAPPVAKPPSELSDLDKVWAEIDEIIEASDGQWTKAKVTVYCRKTWQIGPKELTLLQAQTLRDHMRSA